MTKMELAKSFDPSEIENRWFGLWESSGFFAPRADSSQSGEQRTYCIQLPPPNVTGTLHMGHAFQQTLMDALIRYHRMRGKETLLRRKHRQNAHRHPTGRRAPARDRRQNAARLWT